MNPQGKFLSFPPQPRYKQASTVMYHLSTGIHSETCREVIMLCVNIRVRLHKDGTAHDMPRPLLLLGYKPEQHVSAQNNMRLNQALETMIQLRDTANRSCEAAASVTGHTVLQKSFFLY